MVEFGLELRILLGLQKGRLQLLQRGDEDLRHIAAAKAAEASIMLHHIVSGREGGARRTTPRSPGDP
jgi:hypothetical protein